MSGSRTRHPNGGKASRPVRETLPDDGPLGKYPPIPVQRARQLTRILRSGPQITIWEVIAAWVIRPYPIPLPEKWSKPLKCGGGKSQTTERQQVAQDLPMSNAGCSIGFPLVNAIPWPCVGYVRVGRSSRRQLRRYGSFGTYNWPRGAKPRGRTRVAVT